jgi:hypothetical protein
MLLSVLGPDAPRIPQMAPTTHASQARRYSTGSAFPGTNQAAFPGTHQAAFPPHFEPAAVAPPRTDGPASGRTDWPALGQEARLGTDGPASGVRSTSERRADPVGPLGCSNGPASGSSRSALRLEGPASWLAAPFSGLSPRARALLQSPGYGMAPIPVGLGAIPMGGCPCTPPPGGDAFSRTIQAARDPLPARRAAGGFEVRGAGYRNVRSGWKGPGSGFVSGPSGREWPASGLAAARRAFPVDGVGGVSAPLSCRWFIPLTPNPETLRHNS